MSTDMALAKRKAECIVWTRWCETAREEPAEAEKTQCLDILKRLNAFDVGWTEYATYFWARLMERVRVRYCKNPDNRTNLTLKGVVCGTLMLTAVAMLTDETFLVDNDESWLGIFNGEDSEDSKVSEVSKVSKVSKVSVSQACQFEKTVLADLDYNLELSKWTMAMDKIESAARETRGLDQILVEVSRLEKLSERARQEEDKRGMNIVTRDARRVKRSFAMVTGKLHDLQEAMNSSGPAVYPIVMYCDITGPDLQLRVARLSIE
ncbi:hypothetical protein N7476_004629 [Penicillium atrosanguineum]|uniref:Uncharacterized protein n=1 Tax=Penicillium atrosanguineum TaxID=1132637 RepID=A0A9W9Q1A0_9EURO|nr:hypothetical protein N7476_004629 [Penicillium atrosanguineum]